MRHNYTQSGYKVHLTKNGTQVGRKGLNMTLSMERLKENKNVQILPSVKEMGNWLMRAYIMGISAG